MARTINNASSRLKVAHLAGSNALVLLDGEGPRFGNPTVDAPLRVTVVARSTLVNGQVAPTSTMTIFFVTGREGDTLTGLSAIEGTADQNFFRNDPVAALITAGSLQEIIDAIGSGGFGSLLDTNNLSDLVDVAAARDNLGLGTLATQDGDIAAIGVAIEANTSAIATVASDLDTAESGIAANTSAITGLDERLDTAETTLGTQGTAIAGNTAAIDVLDGRLTTAEGNIGTLQGDVGALQGAVAGQATDIATNSADILTNAASIDAIASDATIVRTSGEYADPDWITSLAGSKITGDIPGNAASITGAIAQSQVTGLTAALDLKADDAAVPHLAGPTNVFTARISSPGASSVAGNEFFGEFAGNSTVSGGNNTSLGLRTLQSLTTGDSNTAIGSNAAAHLTTGVGNIAIGLSSEPNKVSGNHCVAIGTAADTKNFTNSFAIGVGATCTADDQMMLGRSGTSVVISGSARFTGGISAQNAAGTDTTNQFFGIFAGLALTTGVQNCAFGYTALAALVTGNNNTAFGHAALVMLAGSLSENTAFGYSADASKTAGQACVAIGSRTSTGGFSTSTAIGFSAVCTASNQIMIGRATETVVMPGAAQVVGSLKLPASADSAIPNGGIAWSTDSANVLKCRTPAGVLKTITLT